MILDPEERMSNAARFCRIFLLLCVIGGHLFPFSGEEGDSRFFSGIKARSIGPAGMSGRIGAIEAVVSRPEVIYVGAATGGIWKTENGGVTWRPVFDDQPVASIGALAVFQPNPSIVWCGTGEGNPRNSAGVGNGVYRTLDGGKTWTHLGLEKSERIARLALDPRNPDTAYAASLGPAWGDGAERGVFKTTDGGKSWQKVLYIDQKTGAADLAMDPQNPDKLFAAMWEYRRWPWFFKSGGPGSGLYCTVDGGKNWKKLNQGDFPVKGELGRVGLSIAGNDPRVVYALVEAGTSALLRSADGGETWKVVNDRPGIAVRPFYYGDIRVDPENENRLYNLQIGLSVSEDGGKTFASVSNPAKVHPDHHALWIHPENGRLMIDGNDGGVYLSRDRGLTWHFMSNLPFGQFYHVGVDNDTPYNVYGGLQDNSTWWGPSSVWEYGGIKNHHWANIGFGDGFHAERSVDDPRYVYCMWQGGFLMRSDRLTGELKDIRPAGPHQGELRFNWNAGFALDPFNPKTIYLGSQYVHLSPDGGDTWETMSPDLTTNNPDKQRQRESGGLTLELNLAESRHTTITCIAPSPVEKGVLWVGTDDGNVQLTKDGGLSWKNVVKNIKGIPEATWVSHIEPDKFRANSALAAFDNHYRGNWNSYLFRTTDYGETWRSLATPRIRGFIHTVEQDPVDENLLFLGTEFGLFVSQDGGKSWFQWTNGLPAVPVRSLVVHPRDHDLVIGTHGRSISIIDDIRPFRRLTDEILAKPLHLFEIPPAQQYQARLPAAHYSPGDSLYEGENRPYGAVITYYLGPGYEGGKAQLEILDKSGETVRNLEAARQKGVNRIVWDLRYEKFKLPKNPSPEVFMTEGPQALPGEYRARVTAGKYYDVRSFQVVGDPRTRASFEDRELSLRTVRRVGQEIELISGIVEDSKEAVGAVKTIIEKLEAGKDPEKTELIHDGERLNERLISLVDRLVSREGKRVYGDERVLEKLDLVHFSLSFSSDRPTEAQLRSLSQTESELRGIVTEFNRLLGGDYAGFQEKLKSSGVSLLPVIDPVIWDGTR